VKLQSLSLNFMASGYRNVSQAEDSDSEEMKKRRSERTERISAKLHAIFWVAIAAAILYYTNFFGVMLYDRRVNR